MEITTPGITSYTFNFYRDYLLAVRDRIKAEGHETVSDVLQDCPWPVDANQTDVVYGIIPPIEFMLGITENCPIMAYLDSGKSTLQGFRMGRPSLMPPKYNACNDPCDTVDGPCVCGSWHKPGE